jgi:hypothetical protein
VEYISLQLQDFILEITRKFQGSISLEIRVSKGDLDRYLEAYIGRLTSSISGTGSYKTRVRPEYRTLLIT